MSPEGRLSIKIHFGQGQLVGPGKAMILEQIAKHGSIAAAGRSMGMSYKRAWSLIETLNGMFHEPLVNSSRGGPAGGGASLTETGVRVLALYRDIETQCVRSSEASLTDLVMLLKMPD